MRIALIGAGRVASTHIDMLRSADDVEIVAVADPRGEAAERIARQLGVPSFPSLAETLAAVAVDAVDIIVPHDLHYPLALGALQSGVHVFMDKPLATNAADARELCDAAEANGLVLAVCHNLLFHPAAQRTAKLISDGVLGRPTHASAMSSGWLDLPPWDFRLDRKATGGGAWVDGSPHLVYLLESLLGPMRNLHAAAATGDSRLGAEDTAAGHAQFESGAVATITVGYSDASPDPGSTWPAGWDMRVILVGTAGRIVLELLPEARIAWQRDGQPPTQEDFADVTFDSGFYGAFGDFVSAVRSSTKLQVSPWDSLHNLELVRSALDA